jgi:hypothetical protein
MKKLKMSAKFSLFVILFTVVCAATNCDKVGNRKPVIIDSDNKYGLWSGLLSSFDLENGENIFGVTEVLVIKHF